MTDYTADTLTRALEAGARAFLAALDSGAAHAQPVSARPRSTDVIEYDPLVDEPPLPANPAGTDEQKAMASVAYLGAIARINGEHRRGATSAEIAHYAKLAGYPDGRAVNGWNERKDSTELRRAIFNVNGARILHEGGHKWLLERAGELNITVKGDITPLPID